MLSDTGHIHTMKKIKVYGLGCLCKGIEPGCSGLMCRSERDDTPLEEREIVLFTSERQARKQAFEIAMTTKTPLVEVKTCLLLVN